jgi:Leucine-rich repeat (LRR) protein
MNEIIPGVFGNKCLLEYLDIDSNRIEHLGIDVFYGLVNLKDIYLQGNNLQYLHPETFVGLPNLQSLYLSKNSGLQIPTDRHFINSLSLKKLEISGCNISSVSVETFTNVTALAWLDLSYNYLKSVDINILKALPKLSYLYLESNEINEIIPGVFGNNSLLEYLDLDNNKIEHLGIEVFYGLVALKDIYLQGNKLQYLHSETFVGLSNIQSLYLSKNFGLQIPTDSHFITSHSLKHLRISNCNISSVSVETFANVTALERLDLSYNSLRNLNISILKALPKLSTLYLYGNPLQCDCQLQEVWRWCQDHNIQTAYEGMVPECDTPSEVNCIWWGC